MTDRQIEIIKESWKIISNIDPAVVGNAFYNKLFADYPATQKLFSKDMNQQYLKLMEMLNLIVNKLDQLEELSVEIREMAKRHVEYGVKAKHYYMVGESLLWTLEVALKSDWNAELEQAWALCYNTLAKNMMASVEDPA
ncbi:MAG: hemoglobin [Saprospiraceae bacterium]|nr:hemoglobin [Saprospiraceae bacterium]